MRRNLLLIAAIFFCAVLIILLGNVITIGDKLGQVTHVYVEYAFYAIIFLLLLIYVFRPIIKVHRAPEFPVLSVNEQWSGKELKGFAKRLASGCGYIPNLEIRKAHRQELVEKIKACGDNVEELKALVTNEVSLRIDGSKEMEVLGINNRIKDWGKTVFLVTAVSQNSKFDTLAVLVMNYKLISDIVLATGFRPTKPQMFKLYIRVLTTALITYCASQVFTDVDGVAPFDFSDTADIDPADAGSDLADVDVDDAGFGTSLMNNLRKLTIPGVLVGSTIEGCINALLTMRIGFVTRAYLTEGPKALSGVKNKRRVKRRAIKDSLKAMPAVIAHSSAAIGKTTAAVLKGIFVN